MLRARERGVFFRRHSRSRAIRLPVAGPRESEPSVVLCDPKLFCAAALVDVLAGDPKFFGALFPGAQQAADSFATLPSAGPDNPRKLGFSCAILEAKFMPEAIERLSESRLAISDYRLSLDRSLALSRSQSLESIHRMT